MPSKMFRLLKCALMMEVTATSRSSMEPTKNISHPSTEVRGRKCLTDRDVCAFSCIKFQVKVIFNNWIQFEDSDAIFGTRSVLKLTKHYWQKVEYS